MTYPIPDSALDDRLGWIGTSGSGKTYNASAGVEHLLHKAARVVIVDPLDVWWGLRLSADGKVQSGHNVVIFGGQHADLPLNEHAGALIGETVATMSESCIVSLGGLSTKASERRFMLAFLDAIYRHADPKKADPFHIVFDEADLWAPQKSSEPMLQSRMEEIVRRGRIKGFIPWLITQRPAVLSKDVLSQVDGLIAFKLTSSQDRDAIGAWIEGQADKAQGREILAKLPTMQRGEGVVWVPGRGILSTVAFPAKGTFDSSRTPKRGEKRSTTTLRPLDIASLKSKLATVEAETKANDPKALKTEIAKIRSEKAALEKQMTAAIVAKIVNDPQAITEAESRGFAAGIDAAQAASHDDFGKLARAWERAGAATEALGVALDRHCEATNAMGVEVAAFAESLRKSPSGSPVPLRERVPTPTRTATPVLPRAKPSPEASGDGTLSGPQLTMLRSLAWWRAMGHDRPSRVQVASIAGWRVTSGHLKNIAGSLRTLGLIDYPSDGTITMTAAGIKAAPEPDTSDSLEDCVRAILSGPQRMVFDCLPKDGRAKSREQVASACGWEATSGHIKNILGSMRSLEVVDYPQQGMVARAEWLAS